MAKLSLNKAAKEAGVAKSTLLQSLNSKRMSAEKNEKGHWEIETSELFRVFPRTGSTEHTEPKTTSHEEPSKNSQNSALEVEVKMLREKIEDANLGMPPWIRTSQARESFWRESSLYNFKDSYEFCEILVNFMHFSDFRNRHNF